VKKEEVVVEVEEKKVQYKEESEEEEVKGVSFEEILAKKKANLAAGMRQAEEINQKGLEQDK
jgi:hypothetical protein